MCKICDRVLLKIKENGGFLSEDDTHYYLRLISKQPRKLKSGHFSSILDKIAENDMIDRDREIEEVWQDLNKGNKDG